MILEVDCGNTRIKWRLLCSDTRTSMFAGSGADVESFLSQLAGFKSGSVRFARMVSVRAEGETKRLIEALEYQFAVTVKLAVSDPRLGGVTNGYLEPSLLGSDRWMAIAAAYAITRSACLVLDVGTAVTSDFVTGHGLHLGGYICPGIRLMRTQLERHTRRISYEPGLGSDCMDPGRRTAEAVEHGTELMLIGFINTQLKLAERLLGERYRVVLTGGDAALVASSIPDVIVEPDLVFQGLAIAFPD